MMFLTLLLSVVVWGLIFWLLWWLLAQIALPEPFNKVATIILAVAAVIVIIGLITGQVPPFPFLLIK